ncbi:MAG: DUF2339 domain-containing protein [Phycisphaerales bacterium]|nr:DUF2339 domain-containing protein [Phycisphaerales bacterium]
MKCPRCSQEAGWSASFCAKCGLDFSVLAMLNDLRRSVEAARGESESTANRLRDLEKQILALEPQIVGQFTPTAADAESSQTSADEVIDVDVPSVEIPSVQPHPSESSPIGQSADVPFAATHSPGVAPPLNAPRVDVRSPYKPADGGDVSKEPHLASMLLDRRGRSDGPPSKSASLASELGEIQLGQKWLLIAGLAITVLAVGYFLKYSFDRNWVGPAGRVAMAYGAGLAMLGLGEFCRRRKFEVFGLYIIGGGLAVSYFASYAAFQIYNLFGQVPAFALMVVVTALAGGLSLFYDTKWLAVLGIIGGFLTPIVLSTGTDNQFALMTYMAILNAGILAIATSKQWGLLNYLGMTLTWLLFSSWYVKYYGESKFWMTTFFLNIYFLAYALVPFIYYFVRTERRDLTGFTITIPNAFIAFGYSYVMIRKQFSLEMVSVVSISYSILFFALAAYLYKRNRESVDAIVLLLAKAILFLVITVPILFSEHWITVFWTVQGAVLMWAACRLKNAYLRNGAIALVVLGTAKFLIVDYIHVFDLRVPRMLFKSGYSAMLVERWLASAVVLGALFLSARWLQLAKSESGRGWKDIAPTFYGSFGSVLFIVANIEVAACFGELAPRAVFAAISVLWAVFAAGLMTLGFLRNQSILRRCAIVLFAVTIVKVLVHDMASVDTPFRILSSLVLGVLLISASYLYHRYKSRIMGAEDSAANVDAPWP